VNAHTRKTYQAITQGRAPRGLEWVHFVSFWHEVADDVEPETGDRLAVHLHGHRDVFRRQHDGLVSLDDIERARRLLATAPSARDTGEIVVVAIGAERARIITFELGDGPTTERASRTIRDKEPAGRRLRTVERRRGRDDVHDLTAFFEEVAAALAETAAETPIVALGAGHGKADEAHSLVARLRDHHSALRPRLRGVGHADLSAATYTDLEAAALTVLASE
jgi:hypothetical protein